MVEALGGEHAPAMDEASNKQEKGWKSWFSHWGNGHTVDSPAEQVVQQIHLRGIPVPSEAGNVSEEPGESKNHWAQSEIHKRHDALGGDNLDKGKLSLATAVRVTAGEPSPLDEQIGGYEEAQRRIDADLAWQRDDPAGWGVELMRRKAVEQAQKEQEVAVKAHAQNEQKQKVIMVQENAAQETKRSLGRVRKALVAAAAAVADLP